MFYKVFFVSVLAILGFVYLNDYRGVGRDIVSPVQASENGTVLVELYTSQSCSSCPPADKLLSEIAMIDNVIVMACHVTYWNHLHWKDTLSRHECANRQRSFNASQNSQKNYTPQMVVNGEIGFIGSKRGTAIDVLEKSHPALSLKIEKEGGIAAIHFPKLDTDRTLIVEMFAIQDSFYQEIASGENRGKNIVYTRPIKEIKYLGGWNGAEQIQRYQLPQSPDIHEVVFTVRDQIAGRVIAVGQLRL